MKKPKIAFISLTSCEGCQFSLLDLGEKFFNFLKKVKLVDFHLIEDRPFPDEKLDIAFIEGNLLTKDEEKFVKKVRKQTEILVSLGNCATLGGIVELRNYQKYKKIKPLVKELKDFVRVDFAINGCPINPEEFLVLAQALIQGKIPQLQPKPICQECSLRGTKECFLVKKEICLGPIIQAGCGAICPNNNFPCWGCRGFIPKVNKERFIKTISNFKGEKEVEQTLEFFGLKDELD